MPVCRCHQPVRQQDHRIHLVHQNQVMEQIPSLVPEALGLPLTIEITSFDLDISCGNKNKIYYIITQSLYFVLFMSS